MRRVTKWLRRFALALPIVLAAVLTFYVAVLPGLVRRKAIAAMEEAGVVGGDLRVSGLSPSRLDVTDISLGPPTGAGIRAAAVSADFHWRELIGAGRVRGLDIIGAEWRIVVRGDKVDLGLPSLPAKPPAAEKKPEEETPWPDRVRVRAASVVVDWDGREFRVPGEVTLTHQVNDQWFVEARVDLPGSPVKITSTLGTPATGQSPTTLPGAPASAPDEPVRFLDARVRIGESKLEWNVTGGVTSDRMMRFTATPAPQAGESADAEPAVRLRYEHGPIAGDKNTPAARPSDRVTIESHWDHDGPLPQRLLELLALAGADARELGSVKTQGRVSASIARTGGAADKPEWAWEIDASRFNMRVSGGNLALGHGAVTLNGLSIDADGAGSVGSGGREVRAFRGEFAVKRAAIHAGAPALVKSWLAGRGVDLRSDASLEATGEIGASASLDTSSRERSWRWSAVTKNVAAKWSPCDIEAKPLGLSLTRFAGAGEFDGAFGSDSNAIKRFAVDVHAERASRDGEIPAPLVRALASAGVDVSKLGKVAIAGTIDASVSREEAAGEPAWKWDVSASRLDARVFGGDLAWGDAGAAVRGLEAELHADARLTQRSLAITNASASTVRFTSASGGAGDGAWSLSVSEAARAKFPKVNVSIAALRSAGEAFGTDMQKPASADVTIDTPVRFDGKGMTAELARLAMKPEVVMKGGAITAIRATPRVEGGEFLIPAAQLELRNIAGDIPIAWSPSSTPPATTAPASQPAAAFPTTQPATFADARTGAITVGSAKVYGIEIPALTGRLGFSNSTLLASAVTKEPMLGAATPESRMWLDFSGEKVTGELWVNVPEFELKDPDALGRVVPAAKDVAVTGKITAQMRLPFGDVKSDRLASIKVRDLTWARPKEKLEIAGITGSLAITSFKPLVSEPAQSATIKKLTLNDLEFTDGTMVAELKDVDSILIKEMTWHLSEGGTVATRDLLFTASKPTTNVPLEFRSASIRQLIGVLLGERVEGQGEIEGFLPVRLTLMQDHFKVELLPGKISATPGKGGWVRIQGSKELLDSVLGSVPAEVGSRASEALSDFDYREFVFEVVQEKDDVVGRIQTAGKGRVGKKQEIGGLTINIRGLNDGFNEILKTYQTIPSIQRVMKHYGGMEVHKRE